MQYVRTTLKLKKNLKKEAEKKAIEYDMTLQELFNEAVENYLKRKIRQKIDRIDFKTHDLGEPLDNLSRKDYYPEP